MSVRNLPFLDFVFKLIDNSGTITYIDASAAGIYINELDYQTSSLGEFAWSKDNQCIAWSHD